MPNGSPSSSGRVRPRAMTSRGVGAELGGHPGERVEDLRGRVGVVAGRDRGVGGEDRPLGRDGRLERHERGVALVEVEQPRLDPERGERAGAADTEQDVLREPRVGLADVQARGDPARGQVVLRPLRVEQVERDAADVDAPDLRGDRHVADGDGDGQRLAVGTGDERGGQALGVGVDPVLVLPAAGVDPLAEVALAIEEPDGDERQRAVGDLLEDVAGERAEPAGVDRQRAVDAELGAEVRDGAVRGDRRAGDRGAREIGLHGRLDRGGALEQPGVGGGALERLAPDLAEQPHGVLPAALPAGGIDAGEQLRTARGPGPAVVVGEARERRQRPGDPGRERVGGALQIVVAGSHRGAMMAARARHAPGRPGRGGALAPSARAEVDLAAARRVRQPVAEWRPLARSRSPSAGAPPAWRWRSRRCRSSSSAPRCPSRCSTASGRAAPWSCGSCSPR